MRFPRLARLAPFALIAASLGLYACAGDASPGDEAAGPATDDGAAQELKAQVIGEEDHGKTVVVPLGTSFTIALSENASTGYQWRVAQVDRTLGSPRESVVPGALDRPGSAGVKKFTWSTRSPLNLVGEHAISLEYVRPLADAPPAKTFEVTVDIRAEEAAWCGGRAGARCGEGTFCDYEPAHRCGAADHLGTCRPLPETCLALFDPVCGCDGKTYSNVCQANAAGVAVGRSGACPETQED